MLLARLSGLSRFKKWALNGSYDREKGITAALAKLGAERFAGKEKSEFGVSFGARTIINDLRKGVDGWTDQALPKIDFLDDEYAHQVKISFEMALRDCVNYQWP